MLTTLRWFDMSLLSAFLPSAAFVAVSCDADTTSIFNDGKKAYEAKDFARARTLYAQACKSREFASCMLLGNMFRTGEGGAQDMPRARELYDQACKGGVGAACYKLGLMQYNAMGGAGFNGCA